MTDDLSGVFLSARQAVRLFVELKQVRDPEPLDQGARWFFAGGLVLSIEDSQWWLELAT